ncbi:ADP-ribosylglycohydrolase family protein [Melghirimyces algeriensis]|nr:ADP-ribosylglycohydrolase family protein [Melghirimyces algeriensis]
MNAEDYKRGALLGLAWGDVLGCPVEGWREHEIEAVYGLYQALPERYPLSAISEKRRRKLRPLGLHSDDTQQAMALIQVCQSQDGWNDTKWKEILVQGVERESWRGVGRNFVQSVRKMAKGKDVKKTGSPSAGMGAAMRVGPAGALYPENRELRLRVALESSLSTHSDVRAAVFSAVVASSVAGLIQGNSPKEVLKEVPYYAEEAEALVAVLEEEGWVIQNRGSTLISEGLRTAYQWADQPLDTMRQHISDFARPHLQKGFTRAHPNQGFVLLGGLHALLMACRSDAEPNQTLYRIIQLGFDTDTVCAIAGSILGARFGTDWIPFDRLLDQAIGDYADALVSGSVPETVEVFLQREAEWTREERAFQREIRQF